MYNNTIHTSSVHSIFIRGETLIGASLSKPHTSRLNGGGISINVLVRRAVNLTGAPQISVQQQSNFNSKVISNEHTCAYYIVVTCQQTLANRMIPAIYIL